MTLLAPQALWLLALLPVVVALHFLRARRRRRDVSALFLWRRAHAEVARRKRFSPSWLLALQLLFVAAGAFALAGPRLVPTTTRALVVVVDASASMAARSGGGTRLDLAVAAARELLAGRPSAALVRAGAVPRLLVPLEADRAEREAALAGLVAADAHEDLLAAVDLGRRLLPGAEVVVITDHPADLGQAEVVVVGEQASNVGISAFDVGVGQAFVAVVASGRQPEQVTVGLYSGGEELARSTLLVPSGTSGSVTFPLLEDATSPLGVLEARILAAQSDALALDDVAYAGRRALTVVTDDLYAPLLRALQAAPGVAVYGAADATRGQADLHVVTRAVADPAVLPPGNYLLFAPPAQEPSYHVVRSQDRVDPVMRFVDLSDALVGIGPGAALAGGEGGGWSVLARADDLTPLIRARRTAEGAVLQFAFHPSQSDVVLRPAFPALIANWLAELAVTPRIGLGAALPGWAGPALQPGVYELASGAATAPAGAGAGRAGPSGPVALVSLLSAAESRLGAPAPLGGSVGGGVGEQAVEQAPAGVAASAGAGASPLALALVAAALLALAAEWWLYSGARGRRLVG